ncbi:hypothetical protein QTQ03_04595 [Micromonospora sp. WMMA1363]|uniref:hypothetical protein n=1 Tax=Micromonospora sp. WMMA1363 TaxID=3053985 RepID=UPI00259C7E98|nr:hypothetical protein [Micromonospora sp. WMMA1363]MDM4718910.1 hypothetical protein [Micromonospora sp. WMMA1363]
MQEAEVHHALEAYVSDDEPPMGLTSDEILAAGRRSRRNRRLAGMAAAGLAAILFGVGVVAVSGGGGSSTTPAFTAAGPCPFPPGSRPPGVIAADQPLSPELREWASVSVTCHLTEALPRLLPTAQYGQVRGAPAGPLVGHSLGGEPPWGNRVDALALVRDADGTGDLLVNVGVVDRLAAADAADGCWRGTDPRCTVQSGPNGETVLVSTDADRAAVAPPGLRTSLAHPDAVHLTVTVYRGQTEIVVQASNTDRQVVNGRPPVATRPEPVLTVEQARELALSPELYLYP